MRFLEYLKNDPRTCIEEILLLRKHIWGLHETSSFDGNDLRKSIFGQFYQILNAFLGGFYFVISDQKIYGIGVFSDQDLENMFTSYFRTMCAESIEAIENLLREALKEIFPKEFERYKKKNFIGFSDLLNDFVSLEIITSGHKKFLLEWMQILRNPKHSNYVNISGEVLNLKVDSSEQPFSIKGQIDNLLQIANAIVSHPLIKRHDRLIDSVRENRITRDIEWHKFAYPIDLVLAQF